MIVDLMIVGTALGLVLMRAGRSSVQNRLDNDWPVFHANGLMGTVSGWTPRGGEWGGQWRVYDDGGGEK